MFHTAEKRSNTRQASIVTMMMSHVAGITHWYEVVEVIRSYTLFANTQEVHVAYTNATKMGNEPTGQFTDESGSDGDRIAFILREFTEAEQYKKVRSELNIITN